MRERHWPIYLRGNTGAGKTCLAAVAFRGVAAQQAERDEPVWPRWCDFVTFCERLVQIRTSYHRAITIEHETAGTYECNELGWWRRWSTEGLVVIDEIGSRMATDVRYEALWKLLECRRGKPTLVTGNLDERGIQAAFDDRILSRLCNGVWIRLADKDRRVAGFAKREKR